MEVNKRKVISDSMFLSGGNLLLKLKGIIFLPVIISYVGMKNYGAFVQILINPRLLSSFCTLELGMGFYRYTSKYDDTEVKKLSRDYWTVLTTIFILSLFGALALYLLSPIISKYILAGTSLDSLRLSSLFVINGCLNYVNIKYIQGRKKFKLFSVYSIFRGLMPYLGFVAGIMLRSDIFFGLLLYLVISSLLTLSLKVYVIRDLGFSRPSIQILKKFLKYSWALLFSSLTGGLLSKVDRYFIGYFIGPAAIGIYNIVYSVCSLLGALGVPFRKYFSVYMPKIWDKGEQDRVRDQLREGLVYYLTVSIGSLVGIIFLLKPSVYLILGKNLSGIGNIEWLALAIGLGVLGLEISHFFYYLIRCIEKNYLILVFQSIAVVLNVGLNYFLIKEYGVIGAGIATFASYLVVAVLCNYYVRMSLGLNFIARVLKIGAAGLAMGILLYTHTVHDLFDLGVNIVLGLVIYLLSVFLLRIVRFRDIKRRFA